MADIKGGLPTKRIGTYQDHEVLMGKITLGSSEVTPTNGVLGGAGTSGVPVECTSDDHNFFEFYLKSNPSANKSGNGLFIEMEATRDLALYNRTIYTTVSVPAGKHPRNPHAIKALLKIAATGYVQGTGTALLGDVELPNEVMNAACGSIYAGQLQMVVGGDTCDIGDTRHAILMMKVTGGTITGQSQIKNVFDIESLAIGNMAAQLMLSNGDVTGGGAAPDGTLKGFQVRVNGEQYWIALYKIT